MEAITTSSTSSSSTGRSNRSAAFDDPQVVKSMRGLRDKLREASKITGDIDKDVLQLVVQPWMSQDAAFAPFRTGKYPAPQYGWLQQIFVKHFVRQVVDKNIGNIIKNPDRQQKFMAALAKGDAMKKAKGLPVVGYDGQSKRILGNDLRLWWVINRNIAISEMNKNIAPFKTSPLYAQMFKTAAAAFQAKQTVPMYLTTHRSA